MPNKVVSKITTSVSGRPLRPRQNLQLCALSVQFQQVHGPAAFFSAHTWSMVTAGTCRGKPSTAGPSTSLQQDSEPVELIGMDIEGCGAGKPPLPPPERTGPYTQHKSSGGSPRTRQRLNQRMLESGNPSYSSAVWCHPTSTIVPARKPRPP